MTSTAVMSRNLPVGGFPASAPRDGKRAWTSWSWSQDAEPVALGAPTQTPAAGADEFPEPALVGFEDGAGDVAGPGEIAFGGPAEDADARPLVERNSPDIRYPTVDDRRWGFVESLLYNLVNHVELVAD
jgi:hypothetical protein